MNTRTTDLARLFRSLLSPALSSCGGEGGGCADNFVARDRRAMKAVRDGLEQKQRK
jgi:hypothetical protein